MIQISGFTCNKMDAILAFKRIVLPHSNLKDVRNYVNMIEAGHPYPVKVISDEDIKELQQLGFILNDTTMDEIKILMNMLIRKLLLLKKDKMAQNIINMWLQLINEEK